MRFGGEVINILPAGIGKMCLDNMVNFLLHLNYISGASTTSVCLQLCREGEGEGGLYASKGAANGWQGLVSF